MRLRNAYNILLNRLSRVTQSTVLIPEIDGLRFLAIMPVVLLHLCTNFIRTNQSGFSEENMTDSGFYHLINKGSFGVHVFFVISGFVLALPFIAHYLTGEKRVVLKSYYVRRLTRLEPPFIISMTLFFFAWVFASRYSISELLNSLWASVLYVHYFVFGRWSIINPISWSLETEVQFYLIAPLLFSAFLIRNWKWRTILMLLLILVSALINNYQRQFIDTYHLSKSVIVYFPFFLTGALLAEFYVCQKDYFTRKLFGWDVAGILGLAGIYYFHHYPDWFGVILQSAAIAIVFVSAFKGAVFNWIFTRKEIVVIGGMCYSIYLLHYGLLYLFMHVTSNIYLGRSFMINYVTQVLILLPVILAFSAVFFMLFEKPFMHRFWYRDFPKGYFSRLLK